MARWCTVCAPRSKASLKILLAYLGPVTFRAETIFKNNRSLYHFSGSTDVFRLRVIVSSFSPSENESLQIRFSNNSRWKLYINDYSKLKQSAIIYRSHSLSAISPTFNSNSLIISTMSAKSRASSKSNNPLPPRISFLLYFTSSCTLSR